jgi:hypothetical protein
MQLVRLVPNTVSTFYTAEQGQKPLLLLFSATMNPFNFLLVILASISIGTGEKATFTIMLSWSSPLLV